MSFRARLALVAAAAVALAVVVASFVVYFVVRGQLLATVDGSLRTTAAQLENTPLHDFDHFAAPQSELGAAPGYPQLVGVNGRAFLPPGETVALPINNRVIQVARTGRGTFFMDTRVKDTHLRMLEREFLRVLECTVRRCIIDDKDLKLKVGIGDGEDTLDAAHERVLLVVCRDHNRELRHKCASRFC